ncbi:hypothetical protein BHM03_00044429 [Ensete ventricosum]|nr:hypothetical protein BHM03_00044429 [Ensete ventricosum]
MRGTYASTPFDSPSAVYQEFSLANKVEVEEYEHRISPEYRPPGGSLSGGTEAAVARDALEGMIETLSRTKDSIGRATRLAIECAKYGIAGEKSKFFSQVLKLWLERKIMPESLLHRFIDGIEVPNDDVCAGLFLRRPSRAERSVDDPIREMEGMHVDEYGRYV